MRLVSIGAALGVLVLLAGAQSAVAGNPAVAQRTDPSAGSPAGVIYQIPLDSARRDAAPVLRAGSRHDGHGSGSGGGAGGGSGEGPAGGSGSSGGAGVGSQGAGSGGAHPNLAAARGAEGEGGGTPSEPSSIHSENGFGSSAKVPGVSPAAAQMGAGVTATHAASSAFPSYLLIGVIALVAVAVGLVATRVKYGGSPDDANPPPVA